MSTHDCKQIFWYFGNPEVYTSKQNKLLGFSPQANYTDQVTAACWQSWCQPDRGCCVVSTTNPHGF
jgi:hypothetical protein